MRTQRRHDGAALRGTAAEVRRPAPPRRVPPALDHAAGIGWRLLVVAAAVGVAAVVLYALRLVVVPAIVALLLATLLVPPAAWLRRRRWPPLLATWAVLLGGFVDALLVVGLVVVVQQVEGDVLAPVVMGRALSLHPVVILAALTAGAVTAGLLGAFLAVPLTALGAALANEARRQPGLEESPSGPDGARR